MKKIKFLPIFLMLLSFDLSAGSEDEEEGSHLAAVAVPASSIQVLDADPVDPLLTSSSVGIQPESTSQKALRTLQATGVTLLHTSPYVLSKVAISANGMWNGYLYGRLGGDSLASEGVTLTYEFLVMGTCMGGLRATSILVPKLPVQSMGNVSKTSILLATVYNFAVAVPLFLKAGDISSILVSDTAVQNEIQNYFNGFIWGAAPTLYLYADEQYSLATPELNIKGVKIPLAPLLFGVSYASLSSVLAYPLALGEWGFSEHGTYGIGLSMSVGAWVTWLGLRGYFAVVSLNQNREMYNFRSLWDIRTLTKRALWNYSWFSAPLALTNSFGLASGFTYSLLLTSMSKAVAQAYSASSVYYTQLQVALLGYSSAVAAIVSGQDPRSIPSSTKTNSNLRRYVASGIGVGTLAVGAFSIPSLIFPEEFISFFGGALPDHVELLATHYSWFTAASTIIASYTGGVSASLHGLEDIYVPFGIDFLSSISNVASAAVATQLFDNAYLPVVTALCVTTATALVYTGRGVWVLRSVKRGVQATTSFLNRGIERVKSYFSWLRPSPIEDSFLDDPLY